MPTMPAHAPLLEAIKIGRYAAETQRWLLRDVSLALAAGQRVVLVGPTGSGKTLLLRALAMLDPLEEGEVRWHGTTVSRQDLPQFRGRVMYLHQRPALREGTVLDNLQYPFSLSVHRQRQFDAVRIRHLLESLGRQADFLHKTKHDLSGGEAQITALLRALQLDPQVLLLDEPTAALDAATVTALEQCVVQWFRERPDERTIVWVSHSQDQAARIADRQVRLDAGQIREGA